MSESDRDASPDWPIAEFKDIVMETILGTTARGEDGGGAVIPLVKMGNLTWGGVNLADLELISESKVDPRQLLEQGDFLFNTRNTPDLVGKTAVWHGQLPRATFDNNIMRVRLNPAVDADFLCAQLSCGQGRASLRARAAGSTSVAAIYWKDLSKVPVVLPPIVEQRKISAILSAVDDAIEATQVVVGQLQVVIKAMMAELLRRGLPERHKRFKLTEVGELPEGWLIRPCGDLFELQLGKMMSANARSGANQLPYLRNENVHWLRFDLSDVATMHFDEAERPKFRLQSGDLLACEGRHIGRGSVWRNEIDECYFQKALHRLRARSSEITTDYMQFFMMLRFRFMTDLVAEANATSTIPHLPRERLMILPVWYPPREEQDEIVAILTAQVERERVEEEALSALWATKAALMSSLLTGEVRVTIDKEAK